MIIKFGVTRLSKLQPFDRCTISNLRLKDHRVAPIVLHVRRHIGVRSYSRVVTGHHREEGCRKVLMAAIRRTPKQQRIGARHTYPPHDLRVAYHLMSVSH